MSRWAGWRIPHQKLNAWLCPTFHPSYIERLKTVEKARGPLAERIWEDHIEKAITKTNRPWENIPRYVESIFPIKSADDAAKSIEGFIKRGKPIAFDYETDRLKPDHRDARIVCCSVSDGRTTIAYPWYGKAIESTKSLLTSNLPKLGSNIKFESGWTSKLLGIVVRGWVADTMNTAHVLDNRQDICSIKFQAFIHLGQEPWNDHIAQFLESEDDGGNTPNNINKVGLDDLLIYCGMDSLMEHLVCQKQHKAIKVLSQKTQ